MVYINAPYYCLFQLVKQPTLCKNVHDVLFVSLKATVPVVEVWEPFSTSDHNSVYFEVLDSYDDPPHPVKRDFSKSDYVSINQQLQHTIWPEFFSDCANVDEFYIKIFTSLLNSLIENHVPFRKHPSRLKYPRNIRVLQHKKWALWRTCQGPLGLYSLLTMVLSLLTHPNRVLPPLPVNFAPEAISAFQRFKPSFSAGPDGLNAYFLKKIQYSILQPLSSIFKVSFRTGKLPTLWLQALVTLFKKGSPTLLKIIDPYPSAVSRVN